MSKKYSATHQSTQSHNGNGYSHGVGIRRQVEGTTENQKNYIDAIKASDVTFCEGIAGTGKTYMAVGMAIHMLLSGDDKKNRNRISRLIISRPIVPAGGEDIGFLPGDLHEKCDPYMQPIYESIKKFCRDEAEYRKITDRNGNDPLLEVVPLAFMRGRTFDNAFVILDEAQNTTKEQMKMFLSRMGKNCKVVVTGDLSQSDLDETEVENGLVDALIKLEGKEFTMGTVSVCYMDAGDMMRNDLITEIIVALRGDEDDDEDDDEDEEEEEGGEDDDNSGDESDDEPKNVKKQKLDELKRAKIQKTIRNRITPYLTPKQETIDGKVLEPDDSFGAGL